MALPLRCAQSDPRGSPSGGGSSSAGPAGLSSGWVSLSVMGEKMSGDRDGWGGIAGLREP